MKKALLKKHWMEMHDFILQRMIYVQLLDIMGMGEKSSEKKKIEQKKNPFGYLPIPPHL